MITTMLKARRDSSNRLYGSYLVKWETFCDKLGIDPISPPLPKALDFLQALLSDKETDRGYSTIATARSALSSILVIDGNIKFGEHPAVKQFMKGVYQMAAPTPRYVNTWDPEVIITMFKSKDWFPASRLSLLSLSKKLVTLILLASAQRGQIIPALTLDNMKITDNGFQFFLNNKDLKQGRPGYKPEILNFERFHVKKVCIARYLQEYLGKTSDLRGNTREIFITSKKPFKAISRDTVSRWVKSVMREAGLDVQVFKPGSTRAAASSKAMQDGVPLDEILARGGWSNASTFRKFYLKDIV